MIQPLGKRERFSKTTATSADIERLMDAPDGITSTVELVPIARIELDPDQPRRLGLSRENPRNIPTNAPHLKAELEEIEELAEQIRAVGLIQPVGAYRHGNIYRLAWGERRLLACILLGETSIRTEILTERPTSIRAKQLIENIGRRDLSLKDRLHGFQNFVTECEHDQRPILTANDLQRSTGVRKSSAYGYFTLLSAPKDVEQAIEDGTLTAWHDAVRICALGDPVERANAIQAAQSGGVQTPVAAPAKVAAKAVKKPGRPMKAVTLKIGSGGLAKHIVRLLVGDTAFGSYKTANWDDLRVASDILAQVLKKAEKQLTKVPESK